MADAVIKKVDIGMVHIHHSGGKAGEVSRPEIDPSYAENLFLAAELLLEAVAEGDSIVEIRIITE